MLCTKRSRRTRHAEHDAKHAEQSGACDGGWRRRMAQYDKGGFLVKGRSPTSPLLTFIGFAAAVAQHLPTRPRYAVASSVLWLPQLSPVSVCSCPVHSCMGRAAPSVSGTSIDRQQGTRNLQIACRLLG